jgi:hypothetical protein
MLSQASSEAWVRRNPRQTTTRGCASPFRPVGLRVPLVVEGVPSAGGDEPHPAMDAEGAALPPRYRVPGVVALRSRQARVHHLAALRAVAHRRVRPPVVHVLAGGARA